MFRVGGCLIARVQWVTECCVIYKNFVEIMCNLLSRDKIIDSASITSVREEI